MGRRRMGRHGESGGREGGVRFCAVEASIGGRRGGGRGGWHPAISKLPTFLLRLAHVAACVSSADLYDVVPSTPSPGISPRRSSAPPEPAHLCCLPRRRRRQGLKTAAARLPPTASLQQRPQKDAANAAIFVTIRRRSNCSAATCIRHIMSSLRTVSADDSPSSPESISAAFVRANAVTHMDDGHVDDDDLLLKDDSSSPSPESEKPAFVERRPPSKFPPGASRRIPTAQSGRSVSAIAKTTKGSKVSSSKNRGSPSPGNPVIPRRAEDWEPWKQVLHELYISQNRFLRDIIVIMETNYNLRAT